MNDTVSINVRPSDQDIIEFCPVIEIFNDGVIEGTEYFTVFLRESEGANLASCQVAIIDIHGGKVYNLCLLTKKSYYFTVGPSDCYETNVTEVTLAQIINDRS